MADDSPGETMSMFSVRKLSTRRSARNITSKDLDHKNSLQYKLPQLTLKPLFFEVPQGESDPIYIGRNWLITKIESIQCRFKYKVDDNFS